MQRAAKILLAGTLTALGIWLVAKIAVSNRNSDGIEYSVTYHYFTVEGSDPYELRKQLNLRGPHRNGRQNDGYTTWHVDWRIRTRHTMAGCTIRSVRVEVEAMITLPQWEPSPAATADTRTQWDRFARALRTHEEGHRDLAFSAASEIFHIVGSLPESASCDELRESARSNAEGILNRYRSKEIAYDTDTDHGKSQGAKFPGG